MQHISSTVLEVARDDVATTRLVDDEIEIGDGQIRLSVDRFAITANNITYAVFGDVLGYWDFFPTEEAGEDDSAQPVDRDGADGGHHFGRVPAMGWATVVESRAPDIALGRRFYGWYPMAESVVFTPMATTDGFRDDGAHRRQHAPVYRSYVGTLTDPMYDDSPDGEDRHVLLRGLFLTGYLAEEFFADGGGSGEPYFGAANVVVLSASSKTAIGFAQRAARREGVSVVGVTSPGNRAFVESLGFYDRVVAYDEIAEVAVDGGAVSIDMAGNPEALRSVHEHWGDGLAYSMTVGRSHHDAPAADTSDMAGPEPQLFFAPTEVGRRMEQWGREEYGRRCADALAEFVESSRTWLSIEHRVGPDAVRRAWSDVHDGRVAPDVGIVASFQPTDDEAVDAS